MRSSSRWKTRCSASAPTTCWTWGETSFAGSGAGARSGLQSIPEQQRPRRRAALAFGCRGAAQGPRGRDGRGKPWARARTRRFLAREKGIPTITEIPGILALVANGVEVLVDGTRGTLVVAPQAGTRADFKPGWNDGGPRWCAARPPAASPRGRSTANGSASKPISASRTTSSLPWTTAPTAWGCCASSKFISPGKSRRPRTSCTPS